VSFVSRSVAVSCFFSLADLDHGFSRRRIQSTSITRAARSIASATVTRSRTRVGMRPSSDASGPLTLGPPRADFVHPEHRFRPKSWPIEPDQFVGLRRTIALPAFCIRRVCRKRTILASNSRVVLRVGIDFLRVGFGGFTLHRRTSLIRVVFHQDPKFRGE